MNLNEILVKNMERKMFDEYIVKYLVFYLILINATGVILMGIDKNRSVRNKWRVREIYFFIISIIGGSIGTYAGMKIWKHKTKHKHFVWGIPGIFMVQLILTYLLINNW